MTSEYPVPAFKKELSPEISLDMDAQRAFMAELIAIHFPSEKILKRKEDFAFLQYVLDSDIFSAEDTWELHALGVVFGDALIDFIEGLEWWKITDEYGTDPTLRYRDTSLKLNALTMLSKRVEDGEEIDVAYIANWLKNFVETKSHEYQ